MGEDVADGVPGPLHLEPLLVAKPWGGRRLERFGRLLPEGAAIGESWEVADLDPASTSLAESSTRVVTGPLTGQHLHEVIARDRAALLGDADDHDGRFPLLIKLLDAREHLSVQVHPPAAYVAEHADARLKTESWVVLDADPGAELMIGVVDGVTLPMLAEVAGTPAMLPLLRRVPAVAGEVHHLPAGTIHALGAGCLIAEIQTPSDTTFRFYDWTEEYGRAPRQLHIDAGLRAAELAWEHNLPDRAATVTAATSRSPESEGLMLVDTADYRLVEQRLAPDTPRWVESGTLRAVQVLDGTLEGHGFAWPVQAGGTVLLPATWSGDLRAVGRPATLLETTLPAAKRRT